MDSTQPEDRSADDDGGTSILATLNRIADESRDRNRRALADATARGSRLTQPAAEAGQLPRVA